MVKDVEMGNNYNKSHTFDYPYRKIYIEKPGGGYYRLDVYDSISGEIISRKFTQLGAVSEKTAINYINELAKKYPVGAQIGNEPSSGPLSGKILQGDLILEIPYQNIFIPKSIIEAAEAKGITIRDIFGNIYD
jgi:filamentous hemagglutinin